MPTPQAEKFALFVNKVLKECRSSGMTVADIEKATGVSKSTIYRWAAADATIEPRKVWDFCDGLHIPRDAAGRLLGWTQRTEPAGMEPPLQRIQQILADPTVGERQKRGIRETLRGLANAVDMRDMEGVR